MCRMQDGIELAKGQLRAILNTINSQIETNNIINAGPFLYMNMKESPDNHMFAHPVSIRLLCKFLVYKHEVYVLLKLHICSIRSADHSQNSVVRKSELFPWF